MAINPQLYNAAICGLSGGILSERWIANMSGADRDNLAETVETIASVIDTKISVDVAEADTTVMQILLLQSLCQSVFSSRYPIDEVNGDFDEIADSITALFTDINSTFDSDGVNLTSDQITNLSAVAGATVTAALDDLA